MKNKTKVIIFSLIAALASMAGVLLRTFGIFNCYDIGIGYFRSDAHTPKILLWLCILAPICLAVSGVFAAKVNIKSSFSGTASRSGSAFAAVVIILHALFLAYLCMGYVGDMLYIPVLFMIFSAFSAVYFASGCFKASEGRENRALFGFCVILYATAGLAMSYFDFETTMNSPDKLLLQMAYMSVMLYMLFETRFVIGMGGSGRFTVFSFICFFFCTVSALPALIAFFSGHFSGFLASTEYAMSQLGCLAVAVFCALRFADAMKIAKDYTHEELAELKAAKKEALAEEKEKK